jgi:hypothetical protein
VKLISFEAFVSPTVTEMEPLHFSVRLSSLVDVVTIFSPRRYNGCCFDFSAAELASLVFAIVEFLAAYLPSVRNRLEHGIPGLERIALRLSSQPVACENTASESDTPRLVETLIGQPIRRGIVPSSSQDGPWPHDSADRARREAARDWGTMVAGARKLRRASWRASGSRRRVRAAGSSSTRTSKMRYGSRI